MFSTRKLYKRGPVDLILKTILQVNLYTVASSHAQIDENIATFLFETQAQRKLLYSSVNFRNSCSKSIDDKLAF